jgi:hypothetical protein
MKLTLEKLCKSSFIINTETTLNTLWCHWLWSIRKMVERSFKYREFANLHCISPIVQLMGSYWAPTKVSNWIYSGLHFICYLFLEKKTPNKFINFIGAQVWFEDFPFLQKSQISCRRKRRLLSILHISQTNNVKAADPFFPKVTVNRNYQSPIPSSNLSQSWIGFLVDKYGRRKPKIWLHLDTFFRRAFYSWRLGISGKLKLSESSYVTAVSKLSSVTNIMSRKRSSHNL